jgi:hypothetical protein
VVPLLRLPLSNTARKEIPFSSSSLEASAASDTFQSKIKGLFSRECKGLLVHIDKNRGFVLKMEQGRET